MAKKIIDLEILQFFLQNYFQQKIKEIYQRIGWESETAMTFEERQVICWLFTFFTFSTQKFFHQLLLEAQVEAYFKILFN